jgi:hypothetical protein
LVEGIKLFNPSKTVGREEEEDNFQLLTRKDGWLSL